MRASLLGAKNAKQNEDCEQRQAKYEIGQRLTYVPLLIRRFQVHPFPPVAIVAAENVPTHYNPYVFDQPIWRCRAEIVVLPNKFCDVFGTGCPAGAACQPPARAVLASMAGFRVSEDHGWK